MKQKSVVKILLLVNIILVIILIFIFFQTQLFRFHTSQKLPAGFERELILLGGEALQSLDVPVGAIVAYENEIIGNGFNTVFRDDNIAGHAEINALNDAISHIGLEKFLELDRSKLTIFSTYEPCEMCRGTMVHYRINNVKFLKDKTFTRWLKNYRAGMIYEIDKRQAGREVIQDSLFLLHPKYPGQE